MNNQQHCQATKLLLGMTPHPGLHAFMDEYARHLGRGHRLLRHNLETVEFAGTTYGEEGALEAVFHIACDMGLVTLEDLRWARHLRTATRQKQRNATKGHKRSRISD